jgi:hypothetical protein
MPRNSGITSARFCRRAWRFADQRQQRDEHEPRKRGEHERQLPVLHRANDRQREIGLVAEPAQHSADDNQRQPRPRIGRPDEQPNGAPELFGREIIAEQRHAGGRQRRFAHSHQGPRHDQRQEPRCEAARNRRQREDDTAPEDDPHTAACVDHPSDGQRHRGVKDRKGEALQYADLRIRNGEVGLERFDQQVDDLPLEHRHDAAGAQDRDDRPGIGIGAEREAWGCGGARHQSSASVVLDVR